MVRRILAVALLLIASNIAAAESMIIYFEDARFSPQLATASVDALVPSTDALQRVCTSDQKKKNFSPTLA